MHRISLSANKKSFSLDHISLDALQRIASQYLKDEIMLAPDNILRVALISKEVACKAVCDEAYLKECKVHDLVQLALMYPDIGKRVLERPDLYGKIEFSELEPFIINILLAHDTHLELFKTNKKLFFELVDRGHALKLAESHVTIALDLLKKGLRHLKSQDFFTVAKMHRSTAIYFLQNCEYTEKQKSELVAVFKLQEKDLVLIKPIIIPPLVKSMETKMETKDEVKTESLTTLSVGLSLSPHSLLDETVERSVYLKPISTCPSEEKPEEEYVWERPDTSGVRYNSEIFKQIKGKLDILQKDHSGIETYVASRAPIQTYMKRNFNL